MKRRNYAKTIKDALTAIGTYSGALDLQIMALADALHTLDLVRADISKLECTTIKTVSRYGEKLEQHPAFKIQRDAIDTVARMTKQLGLTPAAIKAGEDPLSDFLNEFRDDAD